MISILTISHFSSKKTLVFRSSYYNISHQKKAESLSYSSLGQNALGKKKMSVQALKARFSYRVIRFRPTKNSWISGNPFPN